MARLNRDNQKGFTIVELVVVIIILGILAATALPRFIDVQDDAQLAVAEGVRGALMSAIGLAKAKYILVEKSALSIWMKMAPMTWCSILRVIQQMMALAAAD